MLKQFDEFFLNEQSKEARKFLLGKLEGVDIFLEPLSRKNLYTDKEIFDYMFWKGGDSRKYVVVSINNFNIPFYISTGGGNKKYVEINKWYPFLGYDSTGWLNKGTEDNIRNYYNIKVLREISEHLNKKFGINPETILSREGKAWDKIYGMTEYTLNTINKNMKPVSLEKHKSDPKIFENQIEIIRNGLRKYFPTELVDKNEEDLTKEFMKHMKIIVDDNLTRQQIEKIINEGRFPYALFSYRIIFDFLESDKGIKVSGTELIKEPGKDYKKILKDVLNGKYADRVISKLLSLVAQIYIKMSL